MLVNCPKLVVGIKNTLKIFHTPGLNSEKQNAVSSIIKELFPNLDKDNAAGKTAKKNPPTNAIAQNQRICLQGPTDYFLIALRERPIQQISDQFIIRSVESETITLEDINGKFDTGMSIAGAKLIQLSIASIEIAQKTLKLLSSIIEESLEGIYPESDLSFNDRKPETSLFIASEIISKSTLQDAVIDNFFNSIEKINLSVAIHTANLYDVLKWQERLRDMFYDNPKNFINHINVRHTSALWLISEYSKNTPSASAHPVHTAIIKIDNQSLKRLAPQISVLFDNLNYLPELFEEPYWPHAKIKKIFSNYSIPNWISENDKTRASILKMKKIALAL